MKNQFHEPLPLINTEQLCANLQLCRRTVTNLRNKGVIPYIKLGKAVRYSWPAVEAALNRQQPIAA